MRRMNLILNILLQILHLLLVSLIPTRGGRLLGDSEGEEEGGRV